MTYLAHLIIFIVIGIRDSHSHLDFRFCDFHVLCYLILSNDNNARASVLNNSSVP